MTRKCFNSAQSGNLANTPRILPGCNARFERDASTGLWIPSHNSTRFLSLREVLESQVLLLAQVKTEEKSQHLAQNNCYFLGWLGKRLLMSPSARSLKRAESKWLCCDRRVAKMCRGQAKQASLGAEESNSRQSVFFLQQINSQRSFLPPAPGLETQKLTSCVIFLSWETSNRGLFLLKSHFGLFFSK